MAERSPLVSVVIVNWNGRGVIGECLDALRAQSFKDFEIIVVDNGSTDDSVDFIKRYYPEVRLIELSENRGFAGGNNEGIKIAKGKFIAFLNNDAVPDPDWLKNLMEAVSSGSERDGMWASKILSYYEREIIDSTGLLIYRDGLARGRGRLERDCGQYDNSSDCLIPSGCAALFRREALYNGFDERFFAYSDDVDIGLRARFLGWNCLYIPGARVYHRYSFTASPYSEAKAFLVERNRIWILLKYFPLSMILVSPFFTAIRFCLQFYGILTHRGAARRFTESHSLFKAFLIILRAWWSALKGCPVCLRERRALYKDKRISNKEIRRLFKRFRLPAVEISLKE